MKVVLSWCNQAQYQQICRGCQYNEGRKRSKYQKGKKREMKLICPGCGAIASAESWVNDVHCRETLLIISRLPAPLPKTTLGYLSLFRPGQRALGWKKALRLAGEIEQLVCKNFVSVKGKVDRRCSPRIWAKAMEQMVEQRDGLDLPMPNHRYLKKVAYDMADKADYKQEQRQHAAPVRRVRTSDPVVSHDPLAKIKEEWDKAHQGDDGKLDLTELTGVVKGME